MRYRSRVHVLVCTSRQRQQPQRLRIKLSRGAHARLHSARPPLPTSTLPSPAAETRHCNPLATAPSSPLHHPRHGRGDAHLRPNAKHLSASGASAAHQRDLRLGRSKTGSKRARTGILIDWIVLASESWSESDRARFFSVQLTSEKSSDMSLSAMNFTIPSAARNRNTSPSTAVGPDQQRPVGQLPRILGTKL